MTIGNRNNFPELKSKDDEMCGICYIEFKDQPKNIIKTDCSHYFHVACLHTWCSTQGKFSIIYNEAGEPMAQPIIPTCPVCRYDIPYNCIDVSEKYEEIINENYTKFKTKSKITRTASNTSSNRKKKKSSVKRSVSNPVKRKSSTLKKHSSLKRSVSNPVKRKRSSSSSSPSRRKSF